MILSKPIFFAVLIIFVAAPFWTVRAIWLMRSAKTSGIFGFAGNGFAGDQVREDYSVISFKAGGKEIWFDGLGNLPYQPGQRVPIRYQPDNPYDARVDLFAAIWGDILVFSGIPVLMLLAMFLHPKVIPWRAHVRLTLHRPYLMIVSLKSFPNG